jgi:hypothetical protein
MKFIVHFEGHQQGAHVKAATTTSGGRVTQGPTWFTTSPARLRNSKPKATKKGDKVAIRRRGGKETRIER